jgi:hypothetical protein
MDRGFVAFIRHISGTRIAAFPSVHLTRRPMMKLKLAATAMIAAGLALSGCASHRDTGAAAGTSRSATEVTSDAALTTKVKASLVANAGLGTAADVNVQSFRGVVQLNGFVASEEQARRAAEVAGNVEGVQSVQNNLRVKPGA